MHQTRRLRWLLLSTAALFSGCAAEQEDASETEYESIASSEGAQWRLVEREYPYELSAGVISCADREFVTPAGEVLGADHESYPVANMNRLLSLVGTPEEVPGIDGELRTALAAQGVQRISSCADARTYVSLRNGRSASGRPAEPTILRDELPPIEDDLVTRAMPKIINGSGTQQFNTVGITVPFPKGLQICTGNLIGPFALVTAAHCVPSTGFFTVRAWIQRQGGAYTCISSAGNPCPLNGAANAYMAQHPNYDGSDDFDQAVIIINPGWRAPANSDTYYTRFAANSGLPSFASNGNYVVKIDGYGRNSESGGGEQGRRGNSSHRIDWVSPDGHVLTVLRPDETYSGTCMGDSGSGLYNTSLTLSTNMLLGMHTHPEPNPTNAGCTPAGSSMVYSIPDGVWISNVVNFFGGACSTYTHSVSGQPYVRCW